MKNIGVNKAKTCLVEERISALQVEIRWVINMTWSNEDGVLVQSILLTYVHISLFKDCITIITYCDTAR
jgi:hypothetical protein